LDGSQDNPKSKIQNPKSALDHGFELFQRFQGNMTEDAMPVSGVPPGWDFSFTDLAAFR
jgi:hypothetical protein